MGPALKAFLGADPNFLPEFMGFGFFEIFLIIALAIFKILVNALILTLLLLPLELLGSFILEKLRGRYKLHPLINTFIAVFAVVLLASVLYVFLLPWLPTGVLYLIYWG